ncbi:hypothetical protein JOM56_003700 [Amanita muscaria]
MTSYVEITLWGGLPPPIKEDDVEAVGTFLAHQSMAEGAPAQTFFAELSTCHTTRNLYDKIYTHKWHPSANPTHPRRYFNPSEYQITEIVVLKQRLLIQHEGFIFQVHHEPPPQYPHPAEPDFVIAINRNIDSTCSSSLFSSPKLAIDRVDCFLSPAVQQIEGTFGRPVVWRMPAPGHNYAFNLNLSQVGVLLDAVSFSYPQQQYNALYKNCFSHSRILRAVIIHIIQEQQPAGGNNVVSAYEPKFHGVTLGTCFGFRLDRDQGEDEVVFTNYQNLFAQFLA